MTTSARHRLLSCLLPTLLALAAFLLYARTLAPTVLAGDGGEFQFVPYLLGVAHPTGYPLYVLLGWAWSHLLPLGDVAYRMNLFSALAAAAVVGLLVPTTRLLLRQAHPDLAPALQHRLAALAAATFAVTPTFWSQSIIAEVYGLHIFLVVVLLYLILRWGDVSHRRAYLALLAAFTLGLGLAHHRTTLLLLPALFAYAFLTHRSLTGSKGLSPFLSARLLPRALLLALLPLALYLLIPLRAPRTAYLRLPLGASRELVLYDNTLPGFADFVLGGPFGGSLDLQVDLAARLSMAWGFLRGEVGWPGLLLAALGLTALAAFRRWSLLALTGLAFLATVAFNLFYTIGDIYVLYVPAHLIVVLWLVVGVGLVGRWLSRVSRLPNWANVALVLPAFLLPFWMAASHYTSLDQSANTRARTRWTTLLSQPLPQGAILVSNDRNDIMPMWYLQYVGDGRHPRPLRSDLLGLFPLVTPGFPTLSHVLDLALDTGRPVFLIKEMPGIEVKVDVEAEAGLWRVLGSAVRGEPAHPLDLNLAGAVALRGADWSPDRPAPGEALQVELAWQALQPLTTDYQSFVHLVDADGGRVTQSDHRPGGVYYPTSLWRAGEILRDVHLLHIPPTTPDGIYELLAGMYALSPDGTLVPLADPLPIGQITITAPSPSAP